MAYQIVALGTSVMWCQGLFTEDKIHAQVAKILIEQGKYGQEEVKAQLFAHSGALLGYKDDGTEITFRQNRVDGEVPTLFPTVLQQLEEVEATIDPAEVDLVLADGSINDVSLVRILNPAYSRRDLEPAVDVHCYGGVKKFLAQLLVKFPNAKIVFLAYYPMLTENSQQAFFRAFMDAVGVNNEGNPLGKLLSVVEDNLDDRVIDNCTYFATAANSRFRSVVAELNWERQMTDRLFLAQPDFKPQNAAFASDPWLYGINDDLTAQDPLAGARASACDEAGPLRTILPICKRASAGHLTPKGARAYAEAITALL